MVRTIDFMILGLGSVGRELFRLLEEKQGMISSNYGVQFRCVAIGTAHHGRAWNPEGIPLHSALEAYQHAQLSTLSSYAVPDDTMEWIKAVQADILVELTVLNPLTGQPALDYLKSALASGKHIVTANKGPIANAYRELLSFAEAHQKEIRFESTVMDGIPIFKIHRCGLPAGEIHRLTGILNSTTHLILTEMENGLSFEDAVKKAQDLGIAEADPSNDIDGWDATVKICILANVMMDADLKPSDIDRSGIREITPNLLRQSLEKGQRIKLLCRAWRDETGRVRARVSPEPVSVDHPLGRLTGTATALIIESDVLTPLGLFELANSSPKETAYGVLADMLHILTHTG